MNGWNLHPGWTNRMIDEAMGRDATALQDTVRDMLEDARIPQGTISLIVEMISCAQNDMAEYDDAEYDKWREEWL